MKFPHIPDMNFRATIVFHYHRLLSLWSLAAISLLKVTLLEIYMLFLYLNIVDKYPLGNCLCPFFYVSKLFVFSSHKKNSSSIFNFVLWTLHSPYFTLPRELQKLSINYNVFNLPFFWTYLLIFLQEQFIVCLLENWFVFQDVSLKSFFVNVCMFISCNNWK